MVSEYIGSSLEEVIDFKLSGSKSYNQNEVIKIIFQLLLALQYLENKGVVLRFLDPSRILIKEDVIKIRNFAVDFLFSPNELKLIK